MSLVAPDSHVDGASEPSRADPADRKAARGHGGHSAWRFILMDAVALAVVGGAVWGVFALTHGKGATLASQSALVEASLEGLTAPVAGRVVQAPTLASAAVHKGQVLFRIRTASGTTTAVRAVGGAQIASLGVLAGSVVTPGQTLATLTPNGRFQIVAMISEDVVRNVRVGASATVRLQEDPGATFAGRVQAIWPQTAQTYLGSSLLSSAAAVFIKQTQLVPVAVSLPYSPHGIAVGESAEVQIHVANG